MNEWKTILDYVTHRVESKETNLTDLASRAGVSVWWLQRLRHRAGEVKDPGWTKVGRVFQALGGRAPKVPQIKEK